ncbi:MAG: nucleoside deaminase [Ruminococcaceae bacterium]|nr:nucleoside deaminase [Oscillospiraceae bacterium]
MRLAIEQAKKAELMGEVPIGAVVIKANDVIASAHNLCESTKDPTAHAELLAIQKACRFLGDWRLDDCAIYITAEPCAMCAGAIINSRISRVYFGAFEPNTGACGSTINLFLQTNAYKTTDIYPGVLQAECENLLIEFFRKRRITID